MGPLTLLQANTFVFVRVSFSGTTLCTQLLNDLFFFSDMKSIFVTEQRSVADTPKENLQPNLFLCCDSSDCALLSILPLFFSFIWHENTAFASAIELTCEGSLIYVNLWLLVCQVADQSQFTVGVEGGLWELSCLFQVDLARMHRSANPLRGCLRRSVNMLRANRWCSIKWWLGLFVGFSLWAPPPQWDRDVLFRPVDVSASQSRTAVQPCVFLRLCLATLLPLE